MSLISHIRHVYSQKTVRGWDRIYWCIDLHDVIIEGKYNKFNSGRELAPNCKKVLQLLREHKENCLILWTSSHDDAIDDVLAWLHSEGIFFDYINENPECPDTELCSFRWKFYFNILLDDKAGFDLKTDWTSIHTLLTTEIYK